jgi:hypothetical protein
MPRARAYSRAVELMTSRWRHARRWRASSNTTATATTPSGSTRRQPTWSCRTGCRQRGALRRSCSSSPVGSPGPSSTCTTTPCSITSPCSRTSTSSRPTSPASSPPSPPKIARSVLLVSEHLITLSSLCFTSRCTKFQRFCLPLQYIGEWVAEWKVPNATKEQYQAYAKTQMDVYGRATFGCSYWTVKNISNHWNLQWMINNGYISLKS